MKRLLLVFLMCLLTGCETMSHFLPQPDLSAYDAKITAAQKQFAAQKDQEIAAITTAQQQKDAATQANLESAAGLAFGIYTANSEKPTPDRIDTVIGLQSKELVSRLPPVPADQLIAINEKLKADLNEKLTTLAQVQADYAAAQIKADADKQAIVAAQNVVAQKQADLDATKKQQEQTIADLQTQRHNADILAVNIADANVKTAEDKAALIAWIVKAFVVIGVLCAIGAFALKSITLTGASLLSFGISLFVTYVQPWEVITAGSVVIAIIAFAVGMKFWDMHKLNVAESGLSANLVGAIQDYKTKVGADVFKTTLGTNLIEWSKDDPTTFNAQVTAKLKSLNLI